MDKDVPLAVAWVTRWKRSIVGRRAPWQGQELVSIVLDMLSWKGLWIFLSGNQEEAEFVT